MGANDATEDETGRTKADAGRFTGARDPSNEGLTDEDRAEMKKSLEDAGYKVKDVVTP